MKTIHLLALTFILSLSAGTAYGFFDFFGPKPLEAENGFITIDVETVSDGKAHHFTYDAAGKTIRFFVIKSRDGVIRAALDACDVCWREGKGYSQNGEWMVCDNCGQRFHSARINEARGGCNPAPLERNVEDGKVMIPESDLFAGRRYFL
ncbi:DUF2318 domain-containing protein [Desulfovibrio oxyclinae]|uniref:DUF2318 domain-containing protein n=1 Tax=Desulfovibrio oxyclinae TaxID=63560 RepID=UPI00037FFCC1|nr:DUF2318 domain-containing protein [Desulfovibrio oxyclinae]